MQLECVTDRGLGAEPPNQWAMFVIFTAHKNSNFNASFISSHFALFESASMTKLIKFKSHFKDLNCLTPLALLPLTSGQVYIRLKRLYFEVKFFK